MLTLENLAPFTRKHLVTFTSPMSVASVNGKSPIDVGGNTYAVEIEMPPASSKSVAIEHGSGLIDFAPTDPALAGSIANLVSPRVNGTTWSNPKAASVVGPRLHWVGRIPGTMIVVDLWVLVLGAIAECEIAFTNSDPTQPRLNQEVAEIALEVHPSLWMVIDRAAWRRVQYMTPQMAVLARPGFLGDGQGMYWRFWVSPDPFAVRPFAWGPVFAYDQKWEMRWPMGAPPYGGVTRDQHRSRALAWMSAALPSELSAGALGQGPDPNATGGQEDFGATTGSYVVGGGPSALWELYSCAMLEATRPADYREADGSPIDLANHPNAVYWAQQLHYSRAVSGDRLGKDGSAQSGAGGWRGEDREHLSLHLLGMAQVLTGSAALWHRMRVGATQYLGEFTIDPRLSTSGPGVSRSIGRQLQAATWLSRVDERIAFRTAERIAQKMVPQCRRRTPVAPLTIYVDPRRLGGLPCWTAWEESIAVLGLYQWSKANPSAAFQLCIQSALTVLRWAWYRDSSGKWDVWHNIAWEDGRAVTADTPKERGADSFVSWCLGAARIAHRILADTQHKQLLLSEFLGSDEELLVSLKSKARSICDAVIPTTPDTVEWASV